MELQGRSLLSGIDISREEFMYLIDLSGRLRDEKRHDRQHPRLTSRNIALIFEKTSTRTRAAFEVAAHDEGAHVTYIGPEDSHLGYRESMKDTARVLGRMFDGIEYRGSSQEGIDILGSWAGVPVWNGMTNQWHPTQALADMLTMSDHAEKQLEDASYCYLGNRGNVANSLLVTGALLGMDVRICGPESRHPFPDVQKIATSLAAESGAKVTITNDVTAAVAGADFLYTDSWLPIDRPEEWGERIDLFFPTYQVNAEVMAATGNPAVKFMHNLPALHNREQEIGQRIYTEYGLEALEVTDEVFESPASVVFDQAENRMHSIKAVLLSTLLDPNSLLQQGSL